MRSLTIFSKTLLGLLLRSRTAKHRTANSVARGPGKSWVCPVGCPARKTTLVCTVSRISLLFSLHLFCFAFLWLVSSASAKSSVVTPSVTIPNPHPKQALDVTSQWHAGHLDCLKFSRLTLTFTSLAPFASTTCAGTRLPSASPTTSTRHPLSSVLVKSPEMVAIQPT